MKIKVFSTAYEDQVCRFLNKLYDKWGYLCDANLVEGITCNMQGVFFVFYRDYSDEEQ